MDDPEYSTRYRVDRDFTIVSVADNWNEFANENDAPELANGSIIGRTLWDFIVDPTTRVIYRQLVEQAFDGRSIKFDIRCDSPDARRCAEVSIYPSDDGNVEFNVLTTSVEPREPQPLLRRGNSSPTGLITACSWCNRIKIARYEWDEIEAAVGKLHFFELEYMPSITHGICPDCSFRVNALCES